MKKCNTAKFLCLTFITALTVTVNAQNAPTNDSIEVRRIANEILTNGTAYENLRYLCKKVGARLSGSPNAQKAVEATARMLKEAGADTVYLQPCMVPHWVRGEKEKGFIQMKDGSKHDLKICALGNSVGTGIKGVNASIIEVSSFAELDAMGEAKIKGKIIFFNFPMNPAYISLFKAYGESGVSRWDGPSKAAKYGAVATMVRSLAINPDDYPHTGVLSYNDTFPKVSAFAISTNDANWLSWQLKQNKVKSAYMRSTCAMLADAPSFNVVGELKGTEFPNEFITVGGHLDSWDLAEGAHDDGAGCMQSIEVIRALKAAGVKPKHTIRAVMFMNEENGGKGADKYLELAKEKNEKHLFALESDAGGFTPRGFSFEISDEKFQKVLQWRNLFYEFGVYDFTKGGSGADIEDLKKIGAATAGLNPDTQRYFEVHHAKTDVFEAVSRRELFLGAVNMAALIYLVDKYGL